MVRRRSSRVVVLQRLEDEGFSSWFVHSEGKVVVVF